MTTFYMGEGGIVPKAVYTDMNTVLNKKLGTSTAYTPEEWADIVKDFAPLPEKTASGSIASFSDGADLVPLKSCEVTVTPSQSGTGDPSPSNPRWRWFIPKQTDIIRALKLATYRQRVKTRIVRTRTAQER